LSTGPANCLSKYRALAEGLSHRSIAPALRNERHLHLAGPSPCDLDPASRRCRLRVTLEPDQERIFPWTGSSSIEIEESTTKARNGNRQRRFWEHAIRDDADFERHVDYIHFNPVKHGYVTRAYDWPCSSFHRYVKNGLLPPDWGGDLGQVRGRFGE